MDKKEQAATFYVQINPTQTFHGAKGSKDRRNPVAQMTASTPRTASTSLSASSVTSALTFSNTIYQSPNSYRHHHHHHRTI